MKERNGLRAIEGYDRSFRAGTLVVAWALALCGGCATTTGETLKANAEVVREESTPEKLLERGDAYAAVGDTTRAEQYFAAALSVGADPSLVTRRVIRVCVADQRYHVAVQYAENHLRHYPDDKQVRFALATLYAGLGEPGSARVHLEMLGESSPDDPDVHFALALLYRKDLHDLLRADHHFRHYLRLAPRGPNAAQARANLIVLKGVKR